MVQRRQRRKPPNRIRSIPFTYLYTASQVRQEVMQFNYHAHPGNYQKSIRKMIQLTRKYGRYDFAIVTTRPNTFIVLWTRKRPGDH